MPIMPGEARAPSGVLPGLHKRIRLCWIGYFALSGIRDVHVQ